LAALNAKWRGLGIEQPFQVRMGINTGFCNVGNFGSDERMDYTIIGGEANLAARLQSIAEPGGIVLSYETYALVRDLVRARPRPAIQVQGISRSIVPYAAEIPEATADAGAQVISARSTGLELYLDPEAVAGETADRAVKVLEGAIAALKARRNPAT